MIKDYTEHRDGRIGWWSHLYLFLDSIERRRKRLLNWKHEPFEEREDKATGRKFALFKGRGAKCFHPDKWYGLFPNISASPRPYSIVPVKSCQTCEFHIPAKHYGRKRYAACRWFRENNGLDSPLQIYVKAIEDTKEMLR